MQIIRNWPPKQYGQHIAQIANRQPSPLCQLEAVRSHLITLLRASLCTVLFFAHPLLIRRDFLKRTPYAETFPYLFQLSSRLMLAARPHLAQTMSATLRRAFHPPSIFTAPKPSLALHAVQSAQFRHLAAAPHQPSLAERIFPSQTRGPFARKHFESRVVPFTQKQVYDVVANIKNYREFVPWCTASKVTSRIDDRHMIADLSVGFRLLSDKYSSVVTLDPMRSVSVDVPNSGLFEYLITDWTFAKSADPDHTELSFYLEFAFRNPLYQRATDIFFEEVVKQMVGAFEKRCHTQYRFTDSKGVWHRW